MIGAFYIKITKEEIIYRNCFGMVKTYPYNKISQAIINEYQNIELYVDNKKVITYNLKFGAEILLSNLKNSNVPIKEGKVQSYEIEESKTGKGIQNFTMKVTKVNKYVAIICEIVFLFFAIFSFFVVYTLGVVFFSMATILNLLFLISTFYNCYIIENEFITYKRFLRKNIELPFSKISYVKRLYYDNLEESIYLYSDGKVAMKVSKNYTNYHLLEQLIKEKKWKFEK